MAIEKLYFLIAFLGMLVSNQPVFGQEAADEADFSEVFSGERPAPSHEAPPLRPISDADWQKAAAGLDYSDDLPGKPKNHDLPKPRPIGGGWSPDFGAMSGLVQGLFMLAGAVLIAWLVYRFAAGPRSKGLKPGELLAVSPLDDDAGRLLESDLERMLREARTAGQFGLAVRLYYLLTIKELHQKELINWRREKTNRDYLNELAPSGHGPAFRQATAIFEKVWYGEEAIGVERFAEAEAVFEAFLQKIKA